jgi:hypothetical protein
MPNVAGMFEPARCRVRSRQIVGQHHQGNGEAPELVDGLTPVDGFALGGGHVWSLRAAGLTSPILIAYAAAWARLLKLSLLRMLRTWEHTVCALRESVSAISLLASPALPNGLAAA